MLFQVKNLDAVFPDDSGGLQALVDVNFQVFQQEFLCFIGPSGSGKSTLLRILSGLLTPTRGKVVFHDRPENSSMVDMGYVFQNANLMPWRTVKQNITLPLELSETSENTMEEKAKEMIHLTGLEGFEDSLPGDLSGGMAQRVAIARALVQEPSLLLLDEPFGALDAMTRERMASELLRIWEVKRNTVVMVTHDILEAVFLADRVLVLSPRPGTIIKQLKIPFPRPRPDNLRYSPSFSDLARQLRQSIGLH
jgi:NitT/TauT family transport system ATP-binding protein